MYIYLIICSILFLVIGQSEQQGNKFFEYIAEYECEGKCPGNYTLIAKLQRDNLCTIDSGMRIDANLIHADKSGRSDLNILSARSVLWQNLGEFETYKALSLISFGPLAGKIVYETDVEYSVRHLKKCSSDLGVSYVQTKSAQLLIADHLDVNALLSPSGAQSVIQKTAATVCKGRAVIV